MKARSFISCLVLACALCAPSVARGEDDNTVPALRQPMADPALWGSGITLTVLGGLTTIGGGITYAVGNIQACLFPSCSPNHTLRDIGIGVILGGIGLALIGIPMIVIGGARHTSAIVLAPSVVDHGLAIGVVGRF